MPPRKIFVIRHAEKCKDPDDPDLSAAGTQRAAKLVPWFKETFGKPEFIFATAISRHSERPIQTVEPLAKDLGLPLNATYADQDYGALAKTLLNKHRYDGAKVLVCWHHGNIPSLMRELGAARGTYPNPWDHKVFDVVLMAKFKKDSPPSIGETVEPF